MNSKFYFVKANCGAAKIYGLCLGFSNLNLFSHTLNYLREKSMLPYHIVQMADYVSPKRIFNDRKTSLPDQARANERRKK